MRAAKNVPANFHPLGMNLIWHASDLNKFGRYMYNTSYVYYM